MNPRQRFAFWDVCLRSRFQELEDQTSPDGEAATMSSSQIEATGANANWDRSPHQRVQPLLESRSPFERPSFPCSMAPSGEQLL